MGEGAIIPVTAAHLVAPAQAGLVKRRFCQLLDRVCKATAGASGADVLGVEYTELRLGEMPGSIHGILAVRIWTAASFRAFGPEPASLHAPCQCG